LYQKITVGQVRNGTVVLVAFRQVVLLNPGDYFLSVGCGTWEMGEYIVYHRRFDYMHFQVVGTCTNVGLFDPGSKIDWKQLD
jgi:teichoic acid transport system ATP-binding protein